MSSLVLGKRTRSGGAQVSSSCNKRHAFIVESDGCNVENPFLSSKPRTAKESRNLVPSDRQSEPVSTYSTLVNQTLRTQPVRSAKKAKNEAKSNGPRERLSENDSLLPTQTPTPQTPRKRDVLSKKVPSTPKHRVLLTGQPIIPQSPRLPLTPGGSIITIYRQARQIFTSCSDPSPLIGREDEREQLSKFIQDCLSKRSGGCTYISGPPGTGKSAIVSEVVGSFRASKSILKSCINCMSISTVKEICSQLLEFSCDDAIIYEGQEVETLENNYLSRKHPRKSYIVVLDEIDRILTLDSEILYKLFEWAMHKDSCLILIGIANALDLTDRFLPRLKARDLRPHLLPFLPYTAVQIKAVIESRLISLMPKENNMPDYVPFLHPTAIELCSRKVASQNGDLRKAFEICRQAINVIESETKLNHERALSERIMLESPSKRPLEENLNLSIPQGLTKKSLAKSLATLTVETAPRASISHISKITSSIFGNGTSQRLKVLNLQQKAALCALVALEKHKRQNVATNLSTPSKSKDAAPTVKALYDVYCMLCKRDRVLHPLSNSEFKDLIGSLESLSLVSAVSGRNGSFIGSGARIEHASKLRSNPRLSEEKRLSSCVAEVEVAQTVEGLGGGILKNFLAGEGLE